MLVFIQLANSKWLSRIGIEEGDWLYAKCFPRFEYILPSTDLQLEMTMTGAK